MDPLSWAEAAVAAGVGVTAAAALAVASRARARRWAAVEGLVLGAGGRAGVDLRFAALAGAVVTELAVVVACREAARAADPVALAFALLLALPVVGVAQAALADLARPWVARMGRRAPAAHDDGHEEAAVQLEQRDQLDQLDLLLDRARAEVESARAQVTDAARAATLDALVETIGDYGAARDDLSGAGGDALRGHVWGVIALARSCVADEAREAARTLGVRPDAPAPEIRAVVTALGRIYAGPEALPGTSRERAAELEAAAERLFAARAANVARGPTASGATRRAG